MPPKNFLTAKKKDIDTTILLEDINTEELDKGYNIKEYLLNKQNNNNTTTTNSSSFITKKTRTSKKNIESKQNDGNIITTQLENLGLITIKSDKIEPSCGLYRLFFQNQLY